MGSKTVDQRNKLKDSIEIPPGSNRKNSNKVNQRMTTHSNASHFPLFHVYSHCLQAKASLKKSDNRLTNGSFIMLK